MKLPPRLSLILLALGTVAAPPARACNGRKTSAPPLARVEPLDATTWNVFLPGYVTGKIGLGVHFCAAAFRLPAASPIRAVTGIAMFDAKNASSLRSFRWQKSPAVGASFGRVRAGTWIGFLGQVAGPAAGGVDNTLRFRLTTTSGTTFAQLAAALKQAVIGTDAATWGGDLLDRGRFLLQPTTVVRITAVRNEKLFHNASHTTAATRPTATRADVVYSMQPKLFRFGQGKATGWRGVLQDSNAATAEVVQMGFVKYDANGTKPDTSAAALRTNVEFTLFGTGSGSRAAEWTMTTATAVAIDRSTGIRIVLPEPRAANDALTLHVQDGATLKVPAALRKQYTFVLQGTAAATYLSAGTTVRVAGLYEVPVLQIFNKSKAYGASELLFGPEALFPDAARGDRIGFRVESARHPKGWALVFVAPGYLATPAPTPFGDILVQNVAAIGFPFLLDANGSARTPSVPVPRGVVFAAQGIVFEIQGSNIRNMQFTDAAMVRVQ